MNGIDIFIKIVTRLCVIIGIASPIIWLFLYVTQSPLEPLGRRIHEVQKIAFLKNESVDYTGDYVDHTALEQYGAITWPQGVEVRTLFISRHDYCIRLDYQGETRFVSESGVSKQPCQ